MAAAQNFVTVTRRPPDVEDYIDMLRRYRSWLIGPMFGGLVVAVVVAFLWPDTYVSQAVMRITPPTISDRLVPTVVNMQMQQRLQQMQQEILSRGSLQELIQRPSLDLYKRERLKYPMEDIVQDMRNKYIKIQTVEVAAGGGNRIASAFTISFSYPDRFKAQAVVRELVTKFTEQNVTVQRNNANITSQFLTDEMKQAKDHMDEIEKKLMEFKSANMGRLPEQFQANVAQLNTYQMMVSQANESLSRLQQTKLQLETQLQNNNTNANYYNSILEDQVTVGGPQAQVRNEKLNQLNQRIMNLQSEIAALTEQLTPSHPLIKRAQASLAAMEKQRQEAEKEDLDKQAAVPAAGPTVKRVPNQQAYKAVQDIAAANNVLKTEMQNLNLQMDEKVKQIQELNRMIASYQSRVEGSPQLEGQYLSLTRDLVDGQAELRRFAP